MKTKLLLGSLVALVALCAVSIAGAERIRGTNGDDTIIGTFGDDQIAALAGDDTVDAEGGNDQVYGGPGSDRLLGGAGGDLVKAGDGRDTAYGGDGDDVLHALANDNQSDVLDCGAGKDVAIVNAREPHDLAAANCERVKRVVPTSEQAAADDRS